MKKYIIVIIALLYSFLCANTLFAGAGTWTQKADFEGIARWGAVGFSTGSKGYIGTGYCTDSNICSNPPVYYRDFWEYDPAEDTWTQKADFGGTARLSAVGFSIGSKGYIGTGFDLNLTHKKDFWEYDPAANTWTQKADFGGTARGEAVGFSIGSKGYIGTGSAGLFSEKKDFWEYDPTANTWTQKADFGGTARWGAVGFSIVSKGYIGTGDRSQFSWANDFWEYDPAANTWTQKADFGGGARRQAVGFSSGSKGYMGTGSDGSPTSHVDFWEYDPAANIWIQKADFGDHRDGAVGFSIGSKGYVGMGSGTTGGSIDEHKYDFWEYDPADIIPDPFTFTDQTNVALSTVITSNTITVSGIDAASPISITVGGTYSINGGAYTNAGGTVSNGNTVTVRQTSSGSYSTTTNATLTIGGVSDTFSVTTQAVLTDPKIQVTPGSLNFGYVPVGSTKDLTLTVKNAGGGTLTGNATTSAPFFSIVSGGSYTLGPGESQVVTIRYQPTSQGPHTGTAVFTGTTGVTVPVTGKTEKPLGLPWLLLLLGN
jgi:Abnormal spindle-like microcephaly-assoc'd, ASPM-SPD-2-Hydin